MRPLLECRQAEFGGFVSKADRPAMRMTASSALAAASVSHSSDIVDVLNALLDKAEAQ